MSSADRLLGKKALVTGSGTGIGREVALEFARQGADVVLHYGRSSAGAESAAEEIRTMDRRSAVFHADFDSLEDVRNLADQAIDFLGNIDCLVNNAGITFNRPFFDVTPEQFNKIYHVNIRAQFFLTQRVARNMLEHHGGAVCNLTSIHGLQGAREHSVYAGTKGAIISYTRSLAIELAHKGIRINAIAPGCVMVENYHQVIPGYNEAEMQEAAKNSIPVGRAGTPLDVAKLAVFLCSEDAGYIVGQTIVADGGTTSLVSLMPDFRSELKFSFGKGYVPGV